MYFFNKPTSEKLIDELDNMVNIGPRYKFTYLLSLLLLWKHTSRYRSSTIKAKIAWLRNDIKLIALENPLTMQFMQDNYETIYEMAVYAIGINYPAVSPNFFLNRARITYEMALNDLFLPPRLSYARINSSLSNIWQYLVNGLRQKK